MEKESCLVFEMSLSEKRKRVVWVLGEGSVKFGGMSFEHSGEGSVKFGGMSFNEPGKALAVARLCARFSRAPYTRHGGERMARSLWSRYPLASLTVCRRRGVRRPSQRLGRAPVPASADTRVAREMFRLFVAEFP